jgi:DNA-binding CsgD family transcriptional regulator
MNVTLSPADLDRFESTFATLVSPLSHATLVDWRATARGQLADLLGADRSISMLPLAGEPLLEGSPGTERGMADYASYYHTLDTGLEVKRRELGLEVFDLGDIYDLRTVRNSEIYTDWLRPNQLFDALAVATDIDPALPPAGFWFYHERPQAPAFGTRGLALLRLLLPAVKAGLHAIRHFAEHRAELFRVIDALPGGTAVISAAGDVLHENAAMTNSFADEPEGASLRREIHRVASVVAAVAQRRQSAKTLHAGCSEMPASEVRTARARYRIAGSWLTPGFAASGGVVLVSMECLDPKPLRGSELTARYRLTRREIQVARLAASGRSAPDIARELAISGHTARHHVEAIRTKLGVHRAGEIAKALTQS